MIALAVLAGCTGDGPRCEGAECRPPVTDEDGDGYAVDVDCDDSDASFHPAATDPPGDGIDQDCSGTDAPGADLLDARAFRAWDSPVTFSWAGRRLSAGDIDGDGTDELGVSAPGPLNCGPEPSYGCDNVHADRGNVWIITWEASVRPRPRRLRRRRPDRSRGRRPADHHLGWRRRRRPGLPPPRVGARAVADR